VVQILDDGLNWLFEKDKPFRKDTLTREPATQVPSAVPPAPAAN